MPGGRPAGIKNKSNHRAGGDRKSKVYKKRKMKRNVKKRFVYTKSGREQKEKIQYF